MVEGYVIDSVLGSSRFSITYLARDVHHGSNFVLKENFPVYFTFRNLVSLNAGPLDVDAGDAESFAWSVENFEKEAEQLAAIFHPGVVRVLKTFRSFGTAFYVMPLVEGSSLDEQIEHRLTCGLDFSEDEITGLLWRMLNALECLHDQGICHLDINPGNILITDQGIPCLKNFGAARQHLCERFLTVVESSAYTPPEQLTTGGNVGPWSDIFAFAACLHMAITGEPASVDPKASGKHSTSRVSGRDELSGRYSPELLASIDRALDPSVEARYRSVADWRRALWGGKSEDAEVVAESAPAEDPVIAPDAVEVDDESPYSMLPEKRSTVMGPGKMDEKIHPAESGEKVSYGQSNESEDIIVVSLQDVDFSELIPADSKLRPPISFGRLVGGILLIIGLIGFLKWNYPSAIEEVPVLVAKTRPLPEPNVTATIIPEPDEQPLAISATISAPSAVEEIVPEPLTVAPVADSPPVVEGSEAGEERVFEGISMSWCPPGQFQMGSPWNEKGRFQDETPHQVHLTRGFWIAKTEMTQRQWKQVMGNNPSIIQRDHLPVDQVNWSDVQAWVEKMNQQHPPAPGWKWALPSEAQWEYACRAGTATPIYSGPLEILGERNAPALDPIAWYGGNSSVGFTGDGFDTSIWPEKQYPGGKAGVRDVGGKLPNAWGIHDMLGNVWEWCADWYDAYPLGSVTDPTGPPTGTTRVMRGGSWGNGAVVCRSAVRGEDSPENKGEGLGFRCVIVPGKD